MRDVFIDFKDKQTIRQWLQDADLIHFLRKSKSQFLSTTPVYNDSKKSMLGLRKESLTFKFSHDLVRTGINQWHVMSRKNKGEGGFGSVSQSKLKLVVHKNSIELLPVEDVVKTQVPTRSLSKNSLFNLAKEEAEFQRGHGVNVYEVVDAGDKIITVLEDCGTSLDKLFPLGNQFDFRFRLSVAMRLGSEMLLLQQHDVVHRDLKPSNICFKQLNNGSFQIIFIDFGLSKNISSIGNYEVSGTYNYMAPEQLSSKSSRASDMYAFSAILGELFGAKEILKYKRRQGGDLRKTLQAPFCFDGLFEGYDIGGIDPLLLQDLKQLLEALGNSKPEERPTVNHLNKFFSTIPARLQEYQHYLLKRDRQQSALIQLDNLHQEITGSTHEKIPINGLTKTLKMKEKGIADCLSQPVSPKSHYVLSKTLAEKNQIADLTGRDCPYPNLDPGIQLIEAENKRLSQSILQFKRFEETMTAEEKWAHTNSTGIKQIIHILKSSLPIIQKIKKLQAIGEKKTQDGFLNWYSHSSFFGKGRHTNVDKLYHQLSHLNLVNSQSCLLEDQLTEIEQFIKEHHFVHEKEPDRSQYQNV